MTQEQYRQILVYSHVFRFADATAMDSLVADELRKVPNLLTGDFLDKCIIATGFSPNERKQWTYLSKLKMYIRRKFCQALVPEVVQKVLDGRVLDESPPVLEDEIDEGFYSGSDDGDVFLDEMKRNKATVLRYLAEKVPRLTKLHCLPRYAKDLEGTPFQRSDVPEGADTPQDAIYFVTFSPEGQKKKDWLEGLFATDRPFCVVCPQWVLGTYKPSRGLKVLIVEQYLERNGRKWNSHVPECCWMLGNFAEEGFNTNGSITVEYV